LESVFRGNSNEGSNPSLSANLPMTAKCPKCGMHTSQGTDYAGTLKLAEAGEVKFYCAYCGVQWQPDLDEQKKIADNVRDLLVARSA